MGLWLSPAFPLHWTDAVGGVHSVLVASCGHQCLYSPSLTHIRSLLWLPPCQSPVPGQGARSLGENDQKAVSGKGFGSRKSECLLAKHFPVFPLLHKAAALGGLTDLAGDQSEPHGEGQSSL